METEKSPMKGSLNWQILVLQGLWIILEDKC